MLIQNEFMFLLGGTEKAFSVCSMYCFYFCSNSKIKIPKLQKYAHYKIIIRFKKMLYTKYFVYVAIRPAQVKKHKESFFLMFPFLYSCYRTRLPIGCIWQLVFEQ